MFDDMYILEKQEERTRIEMSIIHEQAEVARYADLAWKEYAQEEMEQHLLDIKGDMIERFLDEIFD